MKLSWNWRKEIKRMWGIEYIEDLKALPQGTLWTTRCSKTKRQTIGYPRDLYESPLTLFFYDYVHRGGKRYGIISDKYGLHLDVEKLPYYDIHPTELSPKQKELLGQQIREKAELAGFQVLVFYNNSPLMSKPYFEMLAASKMQVFFVTRLP